MTFYNDNEPYVAEWLRNLILVGEITDGDVDVRPIQKIYDGLEKYTRCHFFAGIAGWDYALRLAGWPEDREVWTGSCPCQPFSVAGKRKGVSDERHLWPEWFRLVSHYRPATIFGEQVASAIGHGWLDGVFADLEKEGYACGAVVLGAHSVGAPHIRQRLFWVANSECNSGRPGRTPGKSRESARTQDSRTSVEPGRRRDVSGLDNTISDGRRARGNDDTENVWVITDTKSLAFWSDFDIIPCADGKTRRVESGVQPLAHGVPDRMGKLRAYGNAIVPQVAAEFIKAFLETEQT